MKATPERVRTELLDLRHKTLSVTDLGRAVSTAVGKAVPHDGYVLIWFDPISGIRSMDVSENAIKDRGRLLIENEAFHGDANRFTDLAARSCPVGLLGTGAPAERCSIRLHEIIRPAGFTCEARIVLQADAHMWGALVLLKTGRPYNERDVAFLTTLARPLTEIVRQQPIRHAGLPRPGPRPPGVVLLGPHNSTEVISPQAEAWFNDLPDRTNRVPGVAYAVANAARAAWTQTHDRSSTPALTRVRSLAGTWLAVHGCLLDPDPSGRVAVTIQAATPQEMLPAFVAWNRLTPRETEVVIHLLDGMPVKQIARRLDLSILTANDHLKAIYRKTNVHSRDELTACLTTKMP